MIKDELKQEPAEEQNAGQAQSADKDVQDRDPQAQSSAGNPETDQKEAGPGCETSAEGQDCRETSAEGQNDSNESAADQDDSKTSPGADDGEAPVGADGREDASSADKSTDVPKKGLFGKKKKEDTVSKASYDELSGKYDDLNSQYLRLNADFQNFRRRNENTRSEAYADAKADIINDLLGVLDNFDRALANPTEDTKYAEGVELIHRTFLEVVKKAGLTEIEAEGKPFDPNFHNAVMRQPKEGVESDTVITVFQKGYMLNGKVLRPSMVIVSE